VEFRLKKRKKVTMNCKLTQAGVAQMIQVIIVDDPIDAATFHRQIFPHAPEGKQECELLVAVTHRCGVDLKVNAHS
jgi:hypothetical protein